MSGVLNQIRLADGRRLAYAEYGDRRGKPLLLMHGIPGGRLQSKLFDKSAYEAGVRLIAADRPGYGDSDRTAPPSYLGYVRDIRALIDHLAMSQVALAAISGGAGFALACAHLMPERIAQLILISAAIPMPAGRSQEHPIRSRLQQWFLRNLPHLAEIAARHFIPLPIDGQTFLRLAKKMPPADRRAMMDPDIRDALMGGAAHNMLRQGFHAVVSEMALSYQGLEFDLATIRSPVHILHGEADANVRLAVAESNARKLSSARLVVVPGGGHLFYMKSPQTVFELVRDANMYQRGA